MTVRSLCGLAAGGLLLALLATPAFAQSFEGVAVVLEKDEANRTLVVEPPRMTIYVTADAEITDLDGATIKLSELPTAIKHDGDVYEVSGDLTIAYEATRDGDRVVAHKIRRTQGVLD